MSKRILKFSATWCGPCRQLTATIKTLNLAVPVEEIDVDQQPAVAAKFGIRGVPTMLLIDEHDVVINRVTGNQTAESIQKFAES